MNPMRFIFRSILTVLFVSVTITLYAGKKIKYIEEKNINYYPKSQCDTNTYMKERCQLDIYYPKNKKSFKTIIWIHGGGLHGGYKQMPGGLKEKGYAVVGVTYRFHPVVKSPTYIEDVAASVAWVFNNITKYGGDSSAIYITGHSAGGYLCSMVGLDKKYLAKHGIDANRIAGLLPLSGHTITHFTIRKERGIPGTQPVVDSMAPLYHVRKDCSPLVLITGDRELELLGRYEENAYMYRMMKVVGHKRVYLHEIKGLDHNMSFAAIPMLLEYIEKFESEKNEEP